MYLISHNESEKSIYAGMGGVVTAAEVAAFRREVEEIISKTQHDLVHVDFTRVTRFAEDIESEINRLRYVTQEFNAELVVMSRAAQEEIMSDNVRAILEGVA